MSTAISLTTDLGLGGDPRNVNTFNSVDTDGLLEAGRFTEAATRAYLGCYYLSAA